jgi:hypothetical protein
MESSVTKLTESQNPRKTTLFPDSRKEPFLHAASSSAQVLAQDFEIDKSKPFVYIKFDHFGDRKPVSDSESAKGLWLRLVNNCRLPIGVNVLGLGTGDPGVAVNFEVVPTAGRDAPDAEQRKKMPFGYAADVGTLVTIPPKGNLLFSVPAESVTKQWYIQVRFGFVLPGPTLTNVQPAGNYEPSPALFVKTRRKAFWAI